jgi:hypothetical protein
MERRVEQVVMDVANRKTNMLRKYYHREPIQSLKLERYTPSPAADEKQ